MKKTTVLSSLFIVMIFISSVSYGQFTKGQLMLDGTVSFNSSTGQFANTDTTYGQNNNSSNNSAFNFSPSIAEFTSENIMYGIGLNYNISTQSQTSVQGQNKFAQKSHIQGFGFTVYTRHYFPLSKNFYAFLGAGLTPAYSFSNDNGYADTVINSLKYNAFSITASLTAGVAYKLTQRLLVNVTLPSVAYINYRHVKASNYFSSSSGNDFTISLGLTNSTLNNISLGMSFLLHK